jgi:hypothetical protein
MITITRPLDLSGMRPGSAEPGRSMESESLHAGQKKKEFHDEFTI